jgi:hypothetical protein
MDKLKKEKRIFNVVFLILFFGVYTYYIFDFLNSDDISKMELWEVVLCILVFGVVFVGFIGGIFWDILFNYLLKKREIDSNVVYYEYESTEKEILISKTITTLLLVYLFYLIRSDIKILDSEDTYAFFIRPFKISYFIWFFLIVKLFVIFRLIFTKQSKYSFTNFERTFHSMFNNKYGYRIDFEKNIWGILILSIMCGGTAGVHGHSDKLFNPTSIVLMFKFFVLLYTLSMILLRNNVLNTFPTDFIKPYRNTNGLIIVVKYEDYLNRKISDDKPHLTIGQKFDVVFKTFPRNSAEKKLIEIKNPNTPNSPALVCKFKDEGLADAIRGGYSLNAELINIKEEGNLEIKLSLEIDR